jgi:Holliday junction resolvase RusA-like endonuclease
MTQEKFAWAFCAMDFDLMPHPRLSHNRKAMGITREKMHSRSLMRTVDYLSNRDSLAWQLKAAWRRKPIEQPCILKIEVGRTDARKADWDNLGKNAGDALVKAGVIRDDSLIQRGEVTVFRKVPVAYVEIMIYVGEKITPMREAK